MTPITVLGFDYGRKRLGIAVGQSVTGTANPLTVLPVRSGEPDWQVLARLVADWTPGAMILGWPTTADGGPTGLEDEITQFEAALMSRFHLPVHRIDERLSSHEAGQRQTKFGAPLDAYAAQVIIETWFTEVLRRGG